jgi:endonuclease/exonuclease/phosphatase family metal-dependent hydrolase
MAKPMTDATEASNSGVHMPPALKITSFNAEWMNDLFYSDEPRFKEYHKKRRFTGPSIKNVPALCSRIQGTIRQINPDILGIVEGPKLRSQMETFVQEYLHDESGSPLYSVYESPSRRNQRPYLLVKRGVATSVRNLHDEPRYEKMTESWNFYPWGACLREEAKSHFFNRKPLAAEVQVGERRLTIILLHIKSKHISSEVKPSDWGPYVREAILARQKITSEIKQVRDYLNDALSEEMARSIVVMGDLNDGPGRDLFEEQFILQNLVDVIQGTLLEPEFSLYHVLEALQMGAFTVEFEDPIDRTKKRELIDHILVSPEMLTGNADFSYLRGSGKVDHEAWESHRGDNADTVRDDRPSDHRPVSCEIV